MELKKVRKRDGDVEEFDRKKIQNAIWQAARAVGGEDKKLSEKLPRFFLMYPAIAFSPGCSPFILSPTKFMCTGGLGGPLRSM